MLTRIVYTGDGSKTDFDIPFPFLDRTHVTVRVNLVRQYMPGEYYFLEDGRIRFRVAPLDGDKVEIFRETEVSKALVQYQDGSVLTERELNLAVLQNLYLTQETRDLWNATVDGRLVELTQNPNNTADSLMDAVIQDILNSQLLADLRQRISDIDLNAVNITSTQVNVAELRGRVEQLTSVDLEGLDTLIAEERTERIEGDSALAGTLSLIGARSGDSTGFVLNTATVRVSPTESLATRLSAITSRFNNVDALIATEQNTRAAADSAFAGQLTTLTSRVSANEAAITTEATTRANADSAMATRLTTVETRTTNALAQIADEVTARTNADSALTTSLNQALSRIGTAEGLIQTEQQTRATADSAMASRVDGLEADLNSETSAIRATILTEQQTRASADSTLASQISTLQTHLNGNTASIQTLQSVTNGLAAQYMVKTDVNGYVSGFGLYNSGGSSQFIVLANKFALVTPGASPKVPFAMSNGNVYINTDLYMGGGRIVCESNGYMKVEGAGFGTSNQFLEWYGPVMPINQCSEANAICYLRRDGATQQSGLIQNSLLNATALELGSTRIHTGGGRLAPFTIRDARYYVSSGTNASRTLTVDGFVGPNQGTGYNWKRFARHRQDVWLDCQISGDTGSETAILEVQYDGGAWQQITSITFNCNYRGSFPIMIRYTTADSWSTVAFRLRTTQNRTEALRLTVDVANYNESGNPAGSTSGTTGGGGTAPPSDGGFNPRPGIETQIP